MASDATRTPEPLPEKWCLWARTLRAVLCEGLVPLLLLLLKRGQPPRVPVASLAASLEAAGGRLAAVAAEVAAALLADICPETLALQDAQVSVRLTSVSETSDERSTSSIRPASCAGVVAKGFSLALPSRPGEVDAGVAARSAQSKRWRQAQNGFYKSLEAVERELAERQRRMSVQIEAYAAARRAEEPPSLQYKRGAVTAAHGPEAELRTDANVAMAPAAAHDSVDTGGGSACAAGTPDDPTVLGFLLALEARSEYRQQICHVESFAARPALCEPFESLVDGCGRPLLSAAAVKALTCELDIGQLFAHQAEALRAVLRDKKHLCLTTGTSSGKSLAFALPILEEFQRNPLARALVLFPTKALAQDQLSKLKRLFQAVCPQLRVCTFDGDTPKTERASLLQESHVFLTNPDMLHYTILASHSRWKKVLENLRYVVLDEAHVYRGAFGTHAALLLRRFRRVLHHYRASPTFIACSATMSNAGAFFAQLVSLDADLRDIQVVDEDSAGRGQRRFCLWNPPLIEPKEPTGMSTEEVALELHASKRARFGEREGGRAGGAAASRLPPGVSFRTRVSAYEEAAWTLAQAVLRGHRAVCFLQVRSMVEVVLQAAHGHLERMGNSGKALQERLGAYRGGYAAAERRQLERRLFSGELLGVVATNALELGIDIGDLDVTIHVGMPPTVASVWQQAGRAGRRGRPSVAVLVAMDAPMEQHYCRHPREFFLRKIDVRLPDVSNPVLIHGHLLCAAAELMPLSEAEVSSCFGPFAVEVLEECRREGRLVVHKPALTPASVAAALAGGGADGKADSGAGVMFRYAHNKQFKNPKEEMSLRDIDPIQFQVMVRGSMAPIDTLDQKNAFMKLHPGAVYLNQRQTYFVEELEIAKHIAWVAPVNPKRLDYYTESREHTQVVLCGGGRARPVTCEENTHEPLEALATAVSVVRCGKITVHWEMSGFRKKAKSDHRVLDMVELSLPPVEFPSHAVWMDLPGAVLQPVAEAGHSVDRGGLHALEHAMVAMAPICCDVEAAELSCQHTRRDSDPNRYLLLLFESQKGGGGCAPKIYAKWEVLLARAVALLEECPCEEGCPNCIIVPNCGEYNHGLDKAAALKIGRALGFGSASCLPSMEPAASFRASVATATIAPAGTLATPPVVAPEILLPAASGAGVFTRRLSAAPMSLVGSAASMPCCFDLD